MDARTLQWDSPQVKALAAAGDFGGLIRWARIEQRLRLVDLGRKIGYSAGQVSRLERGLGPLSDIRILQNFAAALGIPLRLFGLADDRIRAPVGHTPHIGVGAGQQRPDGPMVDLAVIRRQEEDPMLRRRALTLGLAVPGALVARVDDALASIPSGPQASTADVASKLLEARDLYDVGKHTELVQMLPELLALGHSAAKNGKPDALAALAACYDTATETLSKIGRYGSSRITADRSTVYADMSGSALAQAASARMLSIVLRHQDQAKRAAEITLEAVGKVEATGLTTHSQLAVYTQMLCSSSYTAAAAGDRESALDMIGEAERAATRLQRPVRMSTGLITPAAVSLYKIGTLWALGDSGAALTVGEHLPPAQFPTAERRARLHADMARAWWQWGRADQTAAALLSAFRENPGEVRDRPAMREIVAQLDERHPRTSGVQQLVALIGRKNLRPEQRG